MPVHVYHSLYHSSSVNTMRRLHTVCTFQDLSCFWFNTGGLQDSFKAIFIYITGSNRFNPFPLFPCCCSLSLLPLCNHTKATIYSVKALMLIKLYWGFFRLHSFSHFISSSTYIEARPFEYNKTCKNINQRSNSVPISGPIL